MSFVKSDRVRRLVRQLRVLVYGLEQARILGGVDGDRIERCAAKRLGRRFLLLRANRAIEPRALQAVAIDVGNCAAGDVELESGTIGKRLRERLELGLRQRGDVGAPRGKFDERELLAAAGDRAEDREWRRHDLGDQVDDHADDQAADRELRIVERAGNRQLDVDHAVAILEQRDGKQHRKLGRRRAVDALRRMSAGRARACCRRRACDPRSGNGRRTTSLPFSMP